MKLWAHNEVARCTDEVLRIVRRRPRFWDRIAYRYALVLLLALLAALLTAAPYLYTRWDGFRIICPALPVDDVMRLGPFLLGIIGFVVALAQWRSIRQENSYDKYYAQLNVTHDAINSYWKERHKDNEGALVDHLLNIIVFVDLTNMEYVLGKYRLRYAGRDLVSRVVRHFLTQCRNRPDFREKVLYWVGESEEQAMLLSYESYTRYAARYLVRQAS